MNNHNEEIKKANGAVELDDEVLDGVAGGLVQNYNPTSASSYNFKNGTLCQHCGYKLGKYENNRMICKKCYKDMVGRNVAESELKYYSGL